MVQDLGWKGPRRVSYLWGANAVPLANTQTWGFLSPLGFSGSTAQEAKCH